MSREEHSVQGEHTERQEIDQRVRGLVTLQASQRKACLGECVHLDPEGLLQAFPGKGRHYNDS